MRLVDASFKFDGASFLNKMPNEVITGKCGFGLSGGSTQCC